jgi:hypothetical protein
MKSNKGIPLTPWSLLLVPVVSTFLAGAASVLSQQQRVNRESAIDAEFQKRVSDYVKLRKSAAAQLPALKTTAAPAKILEYQHALAARIVAARPNTTKGNIFTPAIATEFRHLIQITMHGPDAGRIHASLQRGEPVRVNIQVNHPYPAMVPVETSPPSLLLNLPKLPAGLEYRVVGHDLVLHDVDANLVVDFISGTIP